MGTQQTYNAIDAIEELGITDFSMSDTPTNETEFQEYFRKITGKDENGNAILSDNPDDFGVTWQQIQTKLTELNSQKKYKLLRQYPSLEEQMDMQYHDAVNGTTTWKDAIQAVKDANPKPTE